MPLEFLPMSNTPHPLGKFPKLCLFDGLLGAGTDNGRCGPKRQSTQYITFQSRACVFPQLAIEILKIEPKKFSSGLPSHSFKKFVSEKRKELATEFSISWIAKIMNSESRPPEVIPGKSLGPAVLQKTFWYPLKDNILYISHVKTRLDDTNKRRCGYGRRAGGSRGSVRFTFARFTHGNVSKAPKLMNLL